MHEKNACASRVYRVCIYHDRLVGEINCLLRRPAAGDEYGAARHPSSLAILLLALNVFPQHGVNAGSVAGPLPLKPIDDAGI